MSEHGAILTLRDVVLTVAGRTLLGSLSFTVNPTEVATLMGPSGAGKSSLLAYVCGTLDPAIDASGSVTLGHREITQLPAEQRRVGILFQDDVLFPHLSVGGNLAFGLPRTVRGRAARRARVNQALTEADLAGFADRDPATLSGGQRSRIALMRVLLSEPKALLLDEPFSRLERELRQQFRAFVFDHARRRWLPVVLVTHDPEDAAAAGGPVIELEKIERSGK